MFNLKIDNFRGYQNIDFKFSKINILIGENSAGKSSLFKFLLALKQSFYPPNHTESNLTLSGIETDLGNYEETIFNHDKHRNLSFSFEFKEEFIDFYVNYMFYLQNPKSKDIINSQERKKILDKLGIDILEKTKLHFELTSDLSSHKNIKMFIENESIGKLEMIKNSEESFLSFLDEPSCTLKFHSKKTDKTYLIQDIQYSKQAFLTLFNQDSLKTE